MAYMVGDKGPYPSKAGEYCGNHLPGNRILRQEGQTQEQAEYNQTAHLATMRFGRPRPWEAGTTEELEARGWVGLYAKADMALLECETDVPTPPELMEPDHATE